MTIKYDYPVFQCFRYRFDHDDFYVVLLKENSHFVHASHSKTCFLFYLDF
jgi:hypothetical protein